MIPDGCWKWVNDYGNLASVAEFFLSLIGFGLTIASALGARQAAIQARQSVREIQSRLGSQLVANEVTECIRSMEALLKTLDRRGLEIAAQQCRESLGRLARVQESSELTLEERSRVGRSVDDLGQTLSKIEEIRRDKEAPRLLPHQTVKQLSDDILHLNRIAARLRSRSRE